MNTEKGQQFVFGLDVHPGCFTSAKFDSRCKNIRDAEPLMIQDKLDMRYFEKWLLKHTCENDILVMEALSISFQLIRKIESHKRTGIVLDSTKVGIIGKKYLKNDKVDAVKIAKIFIGGFGGEVWVPDMETQKRRTVFFAYQNAVKDSTRICCRIWAFLTSQDVFVTSSIKTKYKKDPEYLYTLKEWDNTEKMILKGYIGDYLQAEKKRRVFESVMAEEVTTDPDMLKLQQFFGIRLVSPYAIMAIVGDIKRFTKPNKLVAYIGLQPQVKDSGKKTFTGNLMKTGRRDLRGILVECAQALINFAPKDHPLCKWAMKLKFRKSNNVVTIAVARKLITAIWYVLNGYSSPLTEISKTIKIKLQKHAITIGAKRRKELGFINISHFVEVKSEELLGFT